MKIIGLDVGEKRIGVAKVDSTTRIAVPVGFLLADGSEWQEIARLMRLNSTSYVVLGLPRSNEGNETKQTLYVRNFARTLSEKIPGVKIRFQDESLTSVEAENRLKKRKKKYVKGDIDAEAAAIILQDFVESFKESDAKPEEKTNLAKKEGEKIALTTKKASHKLRNALIISPIALILILVGITAVLKVRDHVRAERQRQYEEYEASQKAEVFTFTIRPGETIFDVKKHLIEHGYTDAEVEQALSYDYSVEPGLEFLADRPTGASLEGYLYGETHEFYADASATDVIRTYLLGMGNVINANALVERYAAQGLTLFEGVTLASIVQKEAKPADQATVAQVFLTRLASTIKLGSDVTVSYALDVVDPNREVYTDNLAALDIDSCYNTRKYFGLPCGPISNPGLSALLAVAEPTDTSYLYFLTGDDGLMYYSNTEAEHLQNAALYCSELCQVSL